MLLYHGSSQAIERPDVSHNAGFADLGRGFYLTDNHEVAWKRAASRARHEGKAAGVVSVFELDEGCVPWAEWGEGLPARPADGTGLFGLRFAESKAGLEAWAAYIQACRKGETDVPGLGAPAVVRAWIATEEVEMACSGFVPMEEIAELIDPSDLVVQFCLLDQGLIDGRLSFVRAEVVGR